MTAAAGENRSRSEPTKRKRKTNTGDHDDERDDANQEIKSSCTSLIDIPLDPVRQILQRSGVKESVRLSCTCKSFRATLGTLCDPTLGKSPWMLDATEYLFWSPDKRLSFALVSPYHMPWSIYFCGSQHGWLLLCEWTLCKSSMLPLASISLLNPFSRARFHLPDTVGKLRHGGWMTCMSAPPTDPYCVLLARFSHPGGTCSYHAWRPGDSGWQNLEDLHLDYRASVVWIEGRGFITFQSRDSGFSLISLQLFPFRLTTLGAAPPPINLVPPAEDSDSVGCYYLVDSHREGLLLVVMRISKAGTGTADTSESLEFRMLRINLDDGNGAFWVEVESIGDQALFLHHPRQGFLVTAAEAGCQSDCVYFITDLSIKSALPRGSDLQNFSWHVYSLKKKTFRSFSNEPGLDDAPSVWVTPSLI